MKKIIVLVCLLGVNTMSSLSVTAKPKKTTQNAAKKTVTKKQPAKRIQPTAKVNQKKLKTEIKDWEKKKKNLKPLQLRDLIEENHRLRMQNQKLDVDLKAIEVKLRETIKKELMLQHTNAAIRDLSELPPGSYTVDKEKGQVFIEGVLDERYGVDPVTGMPFIKGVIFKVQIGANKDLDLKDVLIDEVHHENLEQEKEENLYKYTIGHFRNYWEANKLKKGLRSMGIQLAWIVPYKDGKRVLLKDVLSTVIEQKKKN